MSSDQLRVIGWQDFEEFWRDLEANYSETPYAFDAYDEEIARIAFKAGREAMRRQLLAKLEHMSSVRIARRDDSEASRLGRAMLREAIEDLGASMRFENN